MNEALSHWSERHHGLITRAAAITLGHSPSEIATAIAHGRWIRVHETVYRIAGSPQTWHQDLLAACLATTGLVAVSHRAAARLWGLDGAEPGILEISTTRAETPGARGVVVHRSTDLDQGQIVLRQGLPVTSPMRSILDYCAVAPLWLAKLALDDALGSQLVSLRAMWATLDLLGRRGRRGAGVLRRLLAERIDPPAGILEGAVQRMFRRFDITGFIPEYEVWVGKRLVARADFARPTIMLLLEFDGFASHSSPAALQRDHERQNELVRLGFVVLRFTSRDVYQRPEWVAAQILQCSHDLSTHVLGTEVGRRPSPA